MFNNQTVIKNQFVMATMLWSNQTCCFNFALLFQNFVRKKKPHWTKLRKI